MKGFCDAFKRTSDGAWLCVRRAVLQGPRASIEVSPGSVFSRGTKVMGFDLAEFLDVEESVRLRTADALTRRTRRAEALPLQPI